MLLETLQGRLINPFLFRAALLCLAICCAAISEISGAAGQARPDLDTPRSAETFRLQNPKSDVEFYLNPFGENWDARRAENPDIPVMLVATFDRTMGGSYGRTSYTAQFNRFLPDYTPLTHPNPNVTYRLDLSDGFKNVLRNAGPAYAYFGGSGFGSNKPRENMPVQKIVNEEVKAINPNLKLFGYHVIAFIEECDLTGYPPMDCGQLAMPTRDPAHEAWFVHRKGTDPSSPANRLSAPGLTQYILDVTNAAFQDHMADGMARSMQNNGLDAVLIDGGGDFPRPGLFNNESPAAYPDYFTDAAYFQGKVAILSKIRQRLAPLGKKVFFNPVQPDVMDETRVDEVRTLLAATDGAYWEDTFAPAKRDLFAALYGPDYWYDRLQVFFDTVAQADKTLIVESNTVRSGGKLPPDYCDSEPPERRHLFICSYTKKLGEVGYEAWLKEEQRIARLNLGLYLLFTDQRHHVYKHHTLMEELSYETSEDFWADYDLKIGRPLAPKERLAPHVFRRWFNNAVVYVNNSPDQTHTVPQGVLQCAQSIGSVCVKPHFVTAEGVPVTSYTLPPETAMIFMVRDASEPHNPSFETVWNWKPNQSSWGLVDDAFAITGRRSLKIPSGLTGSPGLTQAYTFAPNTTYTWSAYVKTEGNQNRQAVAVMVPGGVTSRHEITDGRFVHNDIIPEGTRGWKRIYMSFATQQGGAGNLYAVVQATGGGTVWFDDVQLNIGTPWEWVPEKRGDVDESNVIDVVDLSYLLSRWGSADTAADIFKDANGVVDIFDLSLLLSNWGD